MEVDIEGEARGGFTCFGVVKHRSHVGCPGQSQEPRSMLEGGGELGGRNARVLLEPEHETRIEAARAGGHHQTLEGCEAHGRVDRPAASHRGERSTCPQVARDDPQFLDIEPAQFGRAA